ncbi:hypothetical protein AB0M28_36840 [Streptomyces sp. NPDC051940]|uniref:hypothetical protein n=1 Tax=Streptomyces sp. NPDC051940 TaxID=3155675 RepID=UPI003419E4D3
MGTDIHGWIEYRQGREAPWEAAAALAPLLHGRDYGLFACLFGVRNAANFRPVAADRGFPPDACDIVRGAYADAQRVLGAGLFGATWLRYAEWLRIDWDERAVDPAVWRHAEHGRVGRPGYRPEYARCPPGPGPRPTRREVLRSSDAWWQPVARFMDLLAGRYGARHVRVTVWFDN